MKSLHVLYLALLVLIVCGHASADVWVTLDPAVMTGQPGESLTFVGTIANTSDTTVYLNGWSCDFSGSDTQFTVTGLLDSWPISLAPAGSTGGGDVFEGAIFTVDILSGADRGEYAGQFSVLGGSSADSQDELDAANFQVDVPSVPEPSSLLVLGVPLIGMGVVRRRGLGRDAAQSCTERRNGASA